MFSISKSNFGKLEQVFLQNDTTGEKAGIIPGYGATLNMLILSKNNTLLDIVDGSPNYEYLIGEGAEYCKGMILFPFPNRICGGQYIFEGNTYQLPINEADMQNAIHGFAANKAFAIESEKCTENNAELTLSYTTSGHDEGYPFICKIWVTYTLTADKGLICSTKISNADTKNLPVGLGWHPYFKLGNAGIDELWLKLPTNEELLSNERMIPTGRKKVGIKYKKRNKIETTAFDTGYVVDNNSKNTRTTSLKDKEKDIKLRIWQEVGKYGYNFLQIYTPPHRKSIAIEPMTCATDAFNNGFGLIVLKPNESKHFSFGVLLD
ncbi:MAG: hypothetical protein NW207_09810 [Cytophagales bacterium]|nr:hypothetical protein [Cytophagales bacterium]